MRAISAIALIGVAIVSAASCGAEPGPTATVSAGLPRLISGSDAGALADLQASAAWAEPRCRWLETGAHLLAYRQDTEVYKAARDLGFVEMEQVGTGNRIGTIEPAWRVQLTEPGRTETAKCGRGSSKSTVFGVPVSERRFISGKRTAEPDMYNPNRTVFEVEFEWVPTAAGDRVKHNLTDKMTVEQGLATARVTMLYGDRVINKGPNGWVVQAIHDGRRTASR